MKSSKKIFTNHEPRSKESSTMFTTEMIESSEQKSARNTPLKIHMSGVENSFLDCWT